jgi:hypothetical protein
MRVACIATVAAILLAGAMYMLLAGHWIAACIVLLGLPWYAGVIERELRHRKR